MERAGAGTLAHERVLVAGDFNRAPDHPLRVLDSLGSEVSVEFPLGPTSFDGGGGGEPTLSRIDGFVTKGL